MSDTERSARPRQLTMAGGFVIGGSIFLVLSVFDTITSLQSVEMREEITKVLASPTGSGLGISVSEALSLMRVGLMVAGACAAATAVLGFYVFQRSRPARLALSILAVPILLTAPLTGGLVGALVAVATLMLWSGPARDWFAGRPVRQLEPAARETKTGPWEQTMPPPGERNHGHDQGPTDGAPGDGTHGAARGDGPTDQATPSAASLSTSAHSTQPAATSGYGERPADPQATAWVPPAYSSVARRSTPPVIVKVACILTWVFAGVVALLYLGMLVALIVAQDRMVDFVADTPEWQRANLETDLILPVLWAGCLMFLTWSLGACLLAWFTWRRHNWARWLLLISAAGALVAALFAFPVGILHQAAAALTIGGLVGAAAREWFAGDGRPPGGPGQYYGAGAWPTQQGQYPGGPPPQDPTQYPAGPPQQGPPQQGPTSQGQGQPPSGGKPPVW